VRFLGRSVLDVSPVLNGQVRYHFQGLTNDGQYLVVASSNLDTTALPSEAAADAAVDLAGRPGDGARDRAGGRAPGGTAGHTRGLVAAGEQDKPQQGTEGGKGIGQGRSPGLRGG